MTETLKKYCSGKCRILVPDGGMFVWVEIPETADMETLSEAALRAGVGVVKSAAFAVDPDREGHAFRLNFSAPKDEDIVTGCRIFGGITRQFC